MRLAYFLVAVAIVSLEAGIATAQSIPLETLKHLKAATAFIKVDIAGSPSTGSGFLIERTDATGLIVTNAHVIDGEGKPVRGITCVFHSGTPNEISLPAAVMGVDRSRDLAVVRVLGHNMPDPIDVATEVEIHETLPVYVLGFPFGEALAASSRNPALTITKGSISSIRRNDFDDVVFVQLDGGIDPGNSGGPVVNQQGSLVGISVAKITGSDIGLAIPREQLQEILGGAVGHIEIMPTGSTADLRIHLIDPHNKIRSLKFYSMLRAQAPDTVKRSADGDWNLVSNQMVESRVSLDGVEGKVQTSWRVDDYVFQIKLLRRDGTESTTPPRVYRGAAVMAALQAAKRGMTPNSSPVPRPPTPGSSTVPGTRSTEQPVGEVLHVETFDNSITRAMLAGGGRYLVLQSPLSAKVHIFDFTQQRVVASIPAADNALVAASIDSVFIVSPFNNDYERWSLRDLKKGRGGKLQIPGQIKAISMGHSAKGPLIVNWAGQQGLVDASISAVDTSTFRATLLTPTERRSLPGFPRMRSKGEETVVRASANGTTVGVWNLNRSPQGIEVIRLGRSVSAFYQHDSAGYVVPGPDGSAIFTGRGMYSADLVRKRGSEACFPGATADFYVASIGGGIQVRDANAQIIEMITSPKEFSFSRAIMPAKLQLHERFHLIPQLNLLATMPPSDNQLVIRQVAMGGSGVQATPAAASASGSSPTADASSPGQPQNDFRVWKDKSGKYEIVAKLLGVGSSKVKLEKKDGSEILVPMDVLSKEDLKYARQYRNSRSGR